MNRSKKHIMQAQTRTAEPIIRITTFIKHISLQNWNIIHENNQNGHVRRTTSLFHLYNSSDFGPIMGKFEVFYGSTGLQDRLRYITQVLNII